MQGLPEQQIIGDGEGGVTFINLPAQQFVSRFAQIQHVSIH